MHAIARRGAHTPLESALKVDSGRKIPCCIRESNLRQRSECWSNALPTELHLHPVMHYLHFIINTASTPSGQGCDVTFQIEENRLPEHKLCHFFPSNLLVGAADAEIKVLSAVNQEVSQVLSCKAWCRSGQKDLHAFPTARNTAFLN